MKPCDCTDELMVFRNLESRGLQFNDNYIEIEPLNVYLTIGHTRVRMPMHLFRKFAEWYLEDQSVETFKKEKG